MKSMHKPLAAVAVLVLAALAALAFAGAASATVVGVPQAELRAMLIEALEREMRNDIEGTVALLEQIVAQDADFSVENFETSKGRGMIAHASTELGFCYYKQRRWGDALPHLERAAARVSPRADSWIPAFLRGCRERLAEVGQLAGEPAILLGSHYFGSGQPSPSAGTTVVMLAPFGGETGAGVAWEEATQSATATLGEKSINGERSRTITFTLGSEVAMANGEQVALRVAPYLDEEGRMMVPLRPLVEALGGKVEWEPDAQIVYVTMPTATTEEAPPSPPWAAEEETG